MDEKFEWDIRCADLELSRIQAGFTTDDLLHFAGVMTMAHQMVVADIHIETGSLRGSAKLDILRAGSRSFEAEIRVGGESVGIKNPVRYALSEFFGTSARYGGPPAHSFMKSVGWTPQEFGGNFGQGVPIEDSMLAPVEEFFARGVATPHPERGGL